MTYSMTLYGAYGAKSVLEIPDKYVPLLKTHHLHQIIEMMKKDAEEARKAQQKDEPKS